MIVWTSPGLEWWWVPWAHLMRVRVAGVFEFSIFDEDYRRATEGRTARDFDAIALGLMLERALPFVWLAMPCHDQPAPA